MHFTATCSQLLQKFPPDFIIFHCRRLISRAS
jgi:hypothetical protein